MDNILIALIALLLNAVFGGPRALYEASGLDRVGRIPAKLLRDQEAKFSAPDKQIMLITYALFFAFAVGLVLYFICKGDLKFLEIVVVALFLPVRPAFERCWQIRQALIKGKDVEAKQALEGTVWKHHILLDKHGVARAGIELLAVNFSEKIIHPLIWYLMLGIPGLLVCRVVDLLKEILPASFNAEPQIRQITLSLFVLTRWIASRATAFLWIAVSAFLPSSSIGKTIERLSGQIFNAPARAYVLFSTAIILGLALGGPTSTYANNEWLGVGNPKPDHDDLGKAMLLYGLALLVVFILLGLSL